MSSVLQAAARHRADGRIGGMEVTDAKALRESEAR